MEGTAEGRLRASEGNVELCDVDFAYDGEGSCSISDDVSGSSSIADALLRVMPSWTVDEVLMSCPLTEDDDGKTGSETDSDKKTSVKDGVGSSVEVDAGADIAPSLLELDSSEINVTVGVSDKVGMGLFDVEVADFSATELELETGSSSREEDGLGKEWEPDEGMAVASKEVVSSFVTALGSSGKDEAVKEDDCLSELSNTELCEVLKDGSAT